jgi:hypothetical protein
MEHDKCFGHTEDIFEDDLKLRAEEYDRHLSNLTDCLAVLKIEKTESALQSRECHQVRRFMGAKTRH